MGLLRPISVLLILGLLDLRCNDHLFRLRWPGGATAFGAFLDIIGGSRLAEELNGSRVGTL